MKRDLQKLTQCTYDVLVIGGGINGAAIAHVSALNGLKTALLEKGDFAGGTSSKSTKLIHGGLRYLENFEFGLVRESLRERFIQLKSAPHLVRPLKFVIPVYSSDARPFWMMKFGVWLYDLLSRPYVIERHRVLDAGEVCRMIPGIRQKELAGAVVYSDAQMNDARLCLENVLSAAEHGADAANYVQARSLIQENGKTVGVRAFDVLNQKPFDVKAKRVVCALGPWTNMFMNKENSQSPAQVRTTKGIHILYKGLISQYALLVPARKDRRVFFIIPWMGNSLIGTTDTDFNGHPDDVKTEQNDVDYLINEAKRVLPHMDMRRENIIMTFAGLRPLVYDEGSSAKVSRQHRIKESYSGVVYITGGKYTTYRRIAQDVVCRLIQGPCVDTQKKFSVYGSGDIREDPDGIASRFNMAPDIIQSLMDFYGIRFKDVLALVEGDPGLKEPLCGCSPVIRAQVVYAIKSEMARRPEDVIMRRLTLGYTDCPSGQCRKEIRRIMEDIL